MPKNAQKKIKNSPKNAKKKLKNNTSKLNFTTIQNIWKQPKKYFFLNMVKIQKYGKISKNHFFSGKNKKFQEKKKI